MSDDQPKAATALTPVSVTAVTDEIGETSNLRDTMMYKKISVTSSNQPKTATALTPLSVTDEMGKTF